MIDQRYRKVSFGTAVTDFFKGSVDYSGFTSRAGHWFPVGLIYLIFAGVYTGMFASVYKSYSSIGFFKKVIGFSEAAELYLQMNSDFASLLYIITALFVLLHIPIAASFCRRLRDVGFTTIFASILIALYVILAYFYVALITPVYVIIFFFILMSLPANKVETNNNDEFSKFVFRQSFQAQQYYAQFSNQQYDQFGNPIPNQQNFNKDVNQGFNPQGQQGFNPNAPHGPQNPGFQGQPQGFNPNGPQGHPNPGFQGRPQGFNPQGQPQQNVNPNAPQGGQNPGFNEAGAQEQQAQQAPEVKHEEVVVEQQNAEVTPQVEVAPVVEETPQVEVASVVEEVPQVEETQEVKVEAAGGARSRRLQKLNKAEEEVAFKKRR